MPAPTAKWEIAYADVAYVDEDVSGALYREARSYLDDGWEPFACAFTPMSAPGLLPAPRAVMWFRREKKRAGG